jgi:hypothetical protein
MGDYRRWEINMAGRPETQPLNELIARIIDLKRAEARISPSWVATAALDQLDPPREVERHQPLIYLGCHLELRQLARQQLIKRFEPDDDGEGEKDDLFPELQWRYPIAPNGDHSRTEEPQYILRDLMSAADVRYNVERLRSEAAAKNKHARDLEAWHRTRK